MITLNSSGLTLSTLNELVEYFTAKYQLIYGADINLDADSPDGQMMMIFIQSLMDREEVLMRIYNGFDPDQAIGKVLDHRASINGIQRQAGTRTTTFVSVTVSQALNLYGADQDVQNIFVVSDNAGNRWQLMSSVSLATPGVYQLLFQSEDPGAVYTLPNTITVPVSIILGVTSVNNPTTFATLGINEEKDSELKIRRQKSVALSSQGYLEGLLAALENLSGMASVQVYENVTGSTDADGIPSHSIWAIVSGTAEDPAIANAIYRKRNAGAGMKGTQVYTITQPDGSPFVVRWDIVEAETLFIKFTVESLDGVNPPDVQRIRDTLVSTFVPGVAEKVNINNLSRIIREIDPNVLVTNAGFSSTSGGTYTTTKATSAKNKKFSVTSPNIIITDITISPASLAIANAGTRTFSAAGGFGALTWSFQTNVSGGTINAGTGLYTAGATDGSDVIKVTDSLGNFSLATITVN